MPPVTDMPDLLATLESLAKAATGGDWRPYLAQSRGDSGEVWRIDAGPTMAICRTFGNSLGDQQDAAFIAASNPATILKLCAAVREMEGALIEWVKTRDTLSSDPKRALANNRRLTDAQFKLDAIARAALKARNTRTQEVGE